METSSPFIDFPLCAQCDKPLDKICRILLFNNQCNRSLGLFHGLSFCDDCQMYYVKNSCCSVCDQPVGDEVILQKISTTNNKYVLAWVVCSTQCSKHFKRVAQRWKIRGWCKKCHTYLVETQKNK